MKWSAFASISISDEFVRKHHEMDEEDPTTSAIDVSDCISDILYEAGITDSTITGVAISG